MDPSPIAGAHLRIGRPTDDIEALRRFYCEGVGFEVVGRFKDHDGFDGLMLGFHSMSYHLEFTQRHGHQIGKAPTQDNLLVFYLPDVKAWRDAIERMQRLGYESVKSFNPYWDVQGKTYEDADGYRVVFYHAGWRNEVIETGEFSS